MSRCVAEKLLKGLGFYLYLLKGSLLIRVAAIRGIPVTEIRQQTTLRASNAPVGHFMQRTAEVVPGEDNSVLRMMPIRREVFGFRAPTHQNGIVIAGKTGVKEADQILAIMGHGRLDNVRQVVRMGRFSSD